MLMLTSFEAVWGTLDQRWLAAQAASPAAMAALLERWREHLAGEPAAGPDSASVILWPSRDTEMVPVFLARGLAPVSAIAIRLAGRSTGPAAPADIARDAVVRRATAADSDVVVALHLEQIRFSRQLTGLPERPGIAALLRARYAGKLASPEPLVWLAESGGEAAGMVSVAVGDEAAWAAPFVAVRGPVAYVDCASVTPGRRGSGVAAALIREVHAELDARGIAVTLLHYEPLNPLSVPFWHRSGYRPLRTRWEVSPAR